MRQQVSDDIIDHAGGTISQTARGFVSFLTKSGSNVVPTAFSVTSSATALADWL